MLVQQGPPVLLASSERLGENGGKRWVQIAYEGQWKGHPLGGFRFSREIFDQMVANFRRHPQFGKGGVVAYDLHHGSERPFEAPVEHTLAYAWAHDLMVRENSTTGKWELLALTEYLPNTAKWIREGRIRWVSSAVVLDATDPVTGQKIGPVLTSIAFTNQPFLRDLAALAATARGIPSRETETKSMSKLLSALGLGAGATEEQGLNEIENIRKRNAELEKRIGEQEVDAAIVSHQLDARMRPTLLHHRLSDPAGFALAYPRRESATPPNMAAVLSSQSAAQPTPPAPQQGQDLVSQVATLLSSARVVGGKIVYGAAAKPKIDQEAARKIMLCPGRNKHERAMNFIRSQGGKDLSHEAAHEAACLLLARIGMPTDAVDFSEALFA